MTTRRMLLASSSNCHPFGYLEHCQSELAELFEGVQDVLFVPFARPGGMSHSKYTDHAQEGFKALGIRLRGLHEFASATTAIGEAQGIFIGGGNTFVLLQELYQQSVVELLRKRIAHGLPYFGTSAGSNVAGLTIGTSNDMPIVYPPSFDALAAVPFNINPHYPAVPPDPTHKGETREDRIKEFHCFNSQPVVSLREDNLLRIRDSHIQLLGTRPGILFRAQEPALELAPHADLSFLVSS